MFWVLFTAKSNGNGPDDAIVYMQVRSRSSLSPVGQWCDPLLLLSIKHKFRLRRSNSKTDPHSQGSQPYDTRMEQDRQTSQGPNPMVSARLRLNRLAHFQTVLKTASHSPAICNSTPTVSLDRQ